MLRNALRMGEVQCYSWKANRSSVPCCYREPMQSAAEQGSARIVNSGFPEEQGSMWLGSGVGLLSAM